MKQAPTKSESAVQAIPAAHVVHVFGSMDPGGAELRTMELMAAMSDLVTPVYVTLSGRAGTLTPQIVAAGGTVVPMPLGPRFPAQFLAFLRRARPSVLHTHVPFNPRMLIVVDSDENRMAELVRTLRSGGLIPPNVTLEPRLVDITTPMVHRLVAEFPEIGQSLQFAAAKQVRTERDPISLLRMFQVNLLGALALTEALSNRFPECGHFVVLTDKPQTRPASWARASV